MNQQYLIKVYSQRQKDRVIEVLLKRGFELYKGFSSYPKNTTAFKKLVSFKDRWNLVIFYSNGYIASTRSEYLISYPSSAYKKLDANTDWRQFCEIATKIENNGFNTN